MVYEKLNQEQFPTSINIDKSEIPDNMSPEDFFIDLLSKLETTGNINKEEIKQDIEEDNNVSRISYPFIISIYFKENFSTGDIDFSNIEIEIIDAKIDNLSIKILEKLKKSVIDGIDFDIDKEYKELNTERRRDFGVVIDKSNIPEGINTIDFAIKVIEKLQPNYTQQLSREKIEKDLSELKNGQLEYTLGWLKFFIDKEKLVILVYPGGNIKDNIVLYKAIELIKSNSDFDLNELREQVETSIKAYK